MICRDFERLWNERLDARDAVAPDEGHPLAAHAAGCAACRPIHERYLTLSQAIRVASPLPAPPQGFVARVLAAAEIEQLGLAEVAFGARPWRIARRFVPLAAAAALLAAVWIGRDAWTGRDRGASPQIGANIVVVNTQPADRDDLALALADATSATWQLARAASGPAARVGRQMLDATELPETPTPDSLALPVSIEPAAEVLERVGARVNAGVRPLGGSARNAFGFLFSSSADDRAPAPPRSDGT
jgi:hypothetical protein